ncbi:hypothetical protein C1I98_35350 [Spongiactinospora gelatinilytica]|uniref:DUF1003 domain-containing protein n=1 Tax=Spongiactinospora gelatinilytica TaxID=2666298 RepID=A0A2W2EPH3_9ACTN|nr:DUF1003 domain-containing protein [Spongiactinospora gelatinilytica]PZG24641.1 hypothetical protein C1I98_35350 [Spongiactinospora gelatinilytica]
MTTDRPGRPDPPDRAARADRVRHADRLDQPRAFRRTLRSHYDPETFGKLSERIARFLGTARFLVYMTGFIVVWVLWNTLAPDTWRFDEYPFIFLTLMLSLQASYAAPLILLAQNRQDDRNRVQYEQDRMVAGRNQADTEYLTRELAGLRIALADVATRDFLHAELQRLVDDVRARPR